MNTQTEPIEAFPYKSPTNEIKQRYGHIFELKESLQPRFFKVLFDKVVALIFLLISAPILLLKMLGLCFFTTTG
jgi:lipopolysaccharide/colanic/teichoic acid biosynthesis glycosyltransferase